MRKLKWFEQILTTTDNYFGIRIISFFFCLFISFIHSSFLRYFPFVLSHKTEKKITLKKIEKINKPYCVCLCVYYTLINKQNNS